MGSQSSDIRLLKEACTTIANLCPWHRPDLRASKQTTHRDQICGPVTVKSLWHCLEDHSTHVEQIRSCLTESTPHEHSFAVEDKESQFLSVIPLSFSLSRRSGKLLLHCTLQCLRLSRLRQVSLRSLLTGALFMMRTRLQRLWDP